MSLEIRPAAASQCFDLFEYGERIGEILYNPPVTLIEDGEEITEVEYWDVILWSMTGSGKTWKEDADTIGETKEVAQELYGEFRAERLRENAPHPGMVKSVRPTPTGGQRRR